MTNANGPQDLRRGGEAEAVSVLAEELAAGMEEATVEKCRAAALERFELESEGA